MELTRDPADFNPATSSPLDKRRDVGRRAVSGAGHRPDRFHTAGIAGSGRAARRVPAPASCTSSTSQDRTLERVTHSYTGGDIDSDVQNGLSVTADGSRGGVHRLRRQPLLRRRQSADRRIRRRPGGRTRKRVPTTWGPGTTAPAGTIEVEPGGPTIAARARSKPGGVVVVTVSVPGRRRGQGGRQGPGRTSRASRACWRPPMHGRRGRRAARSGWSCARWSAIAPELRGRGTISGRAQVSYVASRGGRHASTSVRIKFRQVLTSDEGSKRGRK